MAYIEDQDLEFLKDCSPNELDPIVNTILFDIDDGKPRRTEELSKSDGYKAHFEKKQHHKYWQDIAEEIQCFGANTFMTLGRGGKGVLYSEILKDVADKFNIKYEKADSTKRIEELLLRQLVSNAILSIDMNKDVSLLSEFKGKGMKVPENLNKEELNEYVLEVLDKQNANSYYFTECVVDQFFKDLKAQGVNKSIRNTSLVSAAAGATGFLGSRVASIAAQSALRVAGPVAWGASLAMLANDFAGPAYRVTVPIVIQIALLRKKKNTSFGVKNKLSDAVSVDNTNNKINFILYGVIAFIIALFLTIFYFND